MWWSFCVILLCNVWQILCQNPEVSTNVGVIRGLRATDGDYDMFMGIPYAYVNESNPFGVSIPAAPFEKVFEAYDDSAICPQIEKFNKTFAGSLDCMHLNIYVPHTISSDPLPVYVYIYGGYFMIGFAGRFVYGPKYLVRNDIIVVTFNYRVGPYGFMCLGTPEIPGNQGLKDQVTALRWVKNNIAAFGGDPNKVTIGGNSAGGMSTALHVMSENEILFDKVIVQSGAPVNIVESSNLEYPIRLATQAGYSGNDVHEAVEYLKLLPIETVIVASAALGTWLMPCKENDIEGVEKFISNFAYKPKLPKAQNITFIVGYNSNEALSNLASVPQEYYDNFSFGSNFDLLFDLNENELDNLADVVRRFYVGDSIIDSGMNLKLSDFLSDATFVYPAELLIRDYINNGAAKVYRYFFSYSGERNFIKSTGVFTEGGAFHADEIGYLFDVSFFGPPNQEDQLVLDRFSTLFANFVKTGDPTPEISELLPVQWPPTELKTAHTLHVNAELTLEKLPFHQRIAFWDIIYAMYGDRVRQQSHSSRVYKKIMKILAGIFVIVLTLLLYLRSPWKML